MARFRKSIQKSPNLIDLDYLKATRMAQKTEEYMTTAQAARSLGVSIGTVQKLVSENQLEAVRTQGGHRRIFINSVNTYKQSNGYRAPAITGDNICILHQGLVLDEVKLKAKGSPSVKLISHPLDLLGMEKEVDILFIDACSLWLQTTPIALLKGLQERYTVYIYNSDQLPESNSILESKVAHLIPKTINTEFITGFLAGRTKNYCF